MTTRKHLWFYTALASFGALISASTMLGDNTPAGTVPVQVTVTANVASDKRMPSIDKGDVLVKRGNDRLPVSEWVSAQGERAGLELFVLIDEAADGRLGLQFDDLRAFIKDQPPSTLIGIGYMRNATAQIVQDLTEDHTLVANALRLPLGAAGMYGSPYLSVVDLMKRWPASANRHEVIMLTDGIDRGLHQPRWHRGYWLNPNAESAASLAQKTNTNIHSIYTPGIGLRYRTFSAATNGQTNLTMLSDRTGGMSFYLGLHSVVSFRPYLSELQRAINNQYLLSFSVKPGKKSGWQQISLSTEVAGVDFASHDAVWVPAKQ
jgi:hypothetical protein